MKYAVLDNENKCVAIVTMDLIPDDPCYIDITHLEGDVLNKTLVTRNGVRAFESDETSHSEIQNVPVKNMSEKIDELREQVRLMSKKLEEVNFSKYRRK